MMIYFQDAEEIKEGAEIPQGISRHNSPFTEYDAYYFRKGDTTFIVVLDHQGNITDMRVHGQPPK